MAAGVVGPYDYVWEVDADGGPIMSGRDDAASIAAAEAANYRHTGNSTANFCAFPGCTMNCSYGEQGEAFEVFMIATRRGYCRYSKLFEGWGEHVSSIIDFCCVPIDRVMKKFVGPVIFWESLALEPKNNKCLRVIRITSDNIKSAAEICNTINHFGGIVHAVSGAKIYHMEALSTNFQSRDPKGIPLLYLQCIESQLTALTYSHSVVDCDPGVLHRAQGAYPRRQGSQRRCS